LTLLPYRKEHVRACHAVMQHHDAFVTFGIAPPSLEQVKPVPEGEGGGRCPLHRLLALLALVRLFSQRSAVAVVRRKRLRSRS
jgi:hypothetical protein